ncbi:hypothetical protein PMEGAPL128_61280 [Priestia megaterium]
MSTRGIDATLNKSVPFGLPKAQVSEEFIGMGDLYGSISVKTRG